MKRIKAACLMQTIHFQLKDGVSNELNRQAVRSEYENYKSAMSHRGVKFKIMEERTEPDGSIVIKVKRQNNLQPVGDYLD